MRGYGASQGLQFLPKDSNSIVLDVQSLNNIIVNKQEHSIIVGAGATWGAIEEVLAPYGLAINIRQASNIFSVGGSLSANVHGWAHKNGCVANSIEYIEVVTPKGELRRLTSNDDLFGYVLGGYGMFGIIVSAKIKVVPNEVLQEQGELVDIQDYINYYQNTDSAATPQAANTRMHLYRLSLEPESLLQTGIAVNYVAQNPLAPVEVHISKEERAGTRIQRIMTNVARRFAWARKFYWKTESKKITNGQALTQTTIEHMQAPINAMFSNARSDTEWLQEYFLPEDKLADFLGVLGKLLTDNKVKLLNASVRPVIQDKITKMGYANKQNMFAVVLCFNQKLDADSRLNSRRWIKQATKLALARGGTYYLPYQPFASKEQFQSSYPQYKRILAKKAEVDPNNIFNSGFMANYFGEERANPYKDVFFNEDLTKEFGEFLSNVLQDIKPGEFNPLMQDILTYADSAEDIFKELHRRISEISPGFFTAKARKLNALSNLKEALTRQAAKLMEKELKGRSTALNGILEIGYPGRFIKPIIKKLGITGKAEVMQEAAAITDIVQSGFPRGHSKSYKLDYSAPEFTMPSASYDVVTCFVGLHHFNDVALDSFLCSLNKVLRMEGNFLLVEHDVTDDKTYAMASLAHSIFNAVKGASLAEEFDEERNFRSLKDWQDILAKYGFALQVSPQTMIRAGDPSLNTMVHFKKISELELSANPIASEVSSPEFKKPHRFTSGFSVKNANILNKNSINASKNLASPDRL